MLQASWEWKHPTASIHRRRQFRAGIVRVSCHLALRSVSVPLVVGSQAGGPRGPGAPVDTPGRSDTPLVSGGCPDGSCSQPPVRARRFRWTCCVQPLPVAFCCCSRCRHLPLRWSAQSKEQVVSGERTRQRQGDPCPGRGIVDRGLQPRPGAAPHRVRRARGDGTVSGVPYGPG
jgi:hypothetical protein